MRLFLKSPRSFVVYERVASEFCRGEHVFFGLPASLRGRYNNSRWGTLWRNVFKQSLGPVHLQDVSNGNWKNISMPLSEASPQLAWIHG